MRREGRLGQQHVCRRFVMQLLGEELFGFRIGSRGLTDQQTYACGAHLSYPKNLDLTLATRHYVDKT